MTTNTYMRAVVKPKIKKLARRHGMDNNAFCLIRSAVWAFIESQQNNVTSEAVDRYIECLAKGIANEFGTLVRDDNEPVSHL